MDEIRMQYKGFEVVYYEIGGTYVVLDKLGIEKKREEGLLHNDALRKAKSYITYLNCA